MTSATFTSLLGYMLVCSFTPGPGNILALNTTSTYGWKRSRSLILDDPRTSASKKMRPRSNPKRNTIAFFFLDFKDFHALRRRNKS